MVVDKVLSLVQVVHTLLQKKNITLAQALSAITNTVAALESMRNESAWQSMWKEICQSKDASGSRFPSTEMGNLTADGDTDQSRSERPRKIPRIMKDFVVMSTCGQREQHQDCSETAKEGNQWRTQVFYPVIDSVVGEMRRRFLDAEIQGRVHGGGHYGHIWLWP